MKYLLFIALLSKITLQDDFYTLLGKDTARWRYVVSEKEVRDIEMFRAAYEKNILLLKNEGDYKIPRIIHFIWLGPKNFPIESVKNIRTWMAFHPDWTFKFWTDRNRPPPCKGMQVHFVKNFVFDYLKEEYEASENYGQKSDFLRYEILLKEGGIYVDHDANCLKPFDAFHKSFDFFGGLELPHWDIDGFRITAGNGLFGAKPHHPILLGAIFCVKEKWQRQPFNVMNTGYSAFTHAIHKHLNVEGNVDMIFPAAYFFSCEGHPSFYSQHFYWNAWDDDFEVVTPHQKALKQKMQKLYHLMLASLGLLLTSFFLSFARRRRT